MTGLALAILIYLGASGVWDALEPDAVRIKFGNPFRAIVAGCAQLALMVLCLLVLGAAPWVYLVVIVGALGLGALGTAAERR